MRLSHSVAYAVNAALQLARNGRTTPISCGKLAENGHLPERFLLQVLRSLSKQGILQSIRGGTGGFCLGRDPQDITLLDLVEAVDGPLGAGVPANASLTAESQRLLQQALESVVEATRRELAALTLSALAAQCPAANGNGSSRASGNGSSRANGSAGGNGSTGGNGKSGLQVAAVLPDWGI